MKDASGSGRIDAKRCSRSRKGNRDMKDKRKRWRNRRTAAGAAAALAGMGVCIFSAFAGGPSTNVWLTVVAPSVEDRISVTVPTAIGFVVNGSLDASMTGGVSSGDGTVLVPNLRVDVVQNSNQYDVNNPGAGSVEYQIGVVSDVGMAVRNYSTEAVVDGDGNVLSRNGAGVNLTPVVLQIPETANNKRHNWEPKASAPQPVPDDFKKYRIVLDGIPFSDDQKPGTLVVHDTDGTKGPQPVIALEEPIHLSAPPDIDTHGYTAAGTANVPSEKYLTVDVEVGGQRNQYKQIEESVKAGVILWLVEKAAD